MLHLQFQAMRVTSIRKRQTVRNRTPPVVVRLHKNVWRWWKCDTNCNLKRNNNSYRSKRLTIPQTRHARKFVHDNKARLICEIWGLRGGDDDDNDDCDDCDGYDDGDDNVVFPGFVAVQIRSKMPTFRINFPSSSIQPWIWRQYVYPKSWNLPTNR